MRIIEKRRGYFLGTHKGAEIEIERERYRGCFRHRFYIRVRAPDGGHLYDGYSPEGVNTMAQAKREALRGARLDNPSK